MNLPDSLSKQVISGVKIGLSTIFAGSIISTPITLMLLKQIENIMGNSQSFFTEFPVESFMFLCWGGLRFNTLPYIGIGIIAEIYEFPPKGVYMLGMVGMGISFFLGIYLEGLSSGEIYENGIYQYILTLLFYFLYFSPYYFAFLFFTLIKRTRKDGLEHMQ